MKKKHLLAIFLVAVAIVGAGFLILQRYEDSRLRDSKAFAALVEGLDPEQAAYLARNPLAYCKMQPFSSTSHEKERLSRCAAGMMFASGIEPREE